MLTIDDIKRALAKIGDKYGIENAYLFGSYAKGIASESSDVDIIIEKGDIKNYIELSGFRLDLMNELNTDVDVLTTNGVHPKFFDYIKNDRILVYGA